MKWEISRIHPAVARAVSDGGGLPGVQCSDLCEFSKEPVFSRILPTFLISVAEDQRICSKERHVNLLHILPLLQRATCCIKFGEVTVVGRCH